MAASLHDMWASALAETDLRETEPQLVVIDASPPPGVAIGVCVEPGVAPWESEPRLSLAGRHEQLEAQRGEHQVVIHSRMAPAAVLGVMRHELEHVRQFEQTLYIAKASAVLARAVRRWIESSGTPSNVFFTLYRYLPAELDASAAASALVRRSFGSREIATVPTRCRDLVGTPRPSGAPATLGHRILAAAALFPADFGQAIIETFGLNSDSGSAAGAMASCLDEEIGTELYIACLLSSASEHLRQRLAAAAVGLAMGQQGCERELAGVLMDAGRLGESFITNQAARQRLVDQAA